MIATNPMELLKIQGATMAEKIKAGTLKVATPYSTLIRQLGVTGMYTGVLSTLARDVPFSMVYFSLYAQTKAMLLDQQPGAPPQSLGIKPFLAGAIAGTAAAAITCPIGQQMTRAHAGAQIGDGAAASARHRVACSLPGACLILMFVCVCFAFLCPFLLQM